MLNALATASYYAQDLKTAAGAIDKAERVAPDDPNVLRLGALIHAAAGQFAQSGTYLDGYRKSGVKRSARRSAHLARRIEDWRQFHGRGGFQLAQSTSDILGGDNTTTGLAAPSLEDSSDDSSSDDSSDDSSGDTKKKAPPRMAMVDVVIIRSEERHATDKGVNLLNGLSSTLSGNAYALSHTRTANDPGTGANTLVNQFTSTPTLAISATYALNIFNDNNDHNEVLARPSLVALDGKKSEFFTGAVWHVQIDGVSGSEGTVTDIPVGIRLDVTPKFLSNEQVQLEVAASRAFIESRSSQPNFTEFAQTTKTTVTANVVMKVGDTLIISGLSEKETEKLHDGVPLLQDIPGIQYLFSHEDTLDFTKSVLILLTPRQPRYTYADGTKKVDPANPPDADKPQPSLKELTDRPGWFKPASNLDSVFYHLSSFKFYKEFRAGDVTLEKWDNPVDLGTRIKGAVEFIHF